MFTSVGGSLCSNMADDSESNISPLTATHSPPPTRVVWHSAMARLDLSIYSGYCES